MKYNILLTQVCIADYRDKFILKLINTGDVEILVGKVYFEPTTKLSKFVESQEEVNIIRNNFYFGNRICWQNLQWDKVIKYDYLVGELNPRILSTWCLLIVRALLRKKTYLWGHAWSRSGSKSKTESLRHLMRKLSSGLLFYTEDQKNEFINKYPNFKKKLSVAPNSVFLEKEMKPLQLGKNFIYVGRLIKSKKVEVLIKGFIKYAENNEDGLLHIVGSGDELSALKRLANKSIYHNRIVFHGHISDIDQLEKIYINCAASVSPGYVGLSITQSLSFGVPMIISRKEPHSPEIEAMIEGFNGSFFETDDSDSLALQMEYWVKTAIKTEKLSEKIVEDCKKRYSVEKMVAGFLDLTHE